MMSNLQEDDAARAKYPSPRKKYGRPYLERPTMRVNPSAQKNFDVTSALSLSEELVKVIKSDEQRKQQENQRLKQLEKDCESLRNEKDSLQTENKKLESKCQQTDELLEVIQTLKTENNKYKEDLERRQDDVSSGIEQISLEPCSHCERNGTEKNHDDGNTAIPDLSDPNRPIKLGEKYNELYDNEWTDAMEKLGELVNDESENVQKLLDILKKSYKVCEEISEKQMASLQMTLFNPVDSWRSKQAWGEPTKQKTPTSIYKQLKDCRKEMSFYAVENIYKGNASDKFWYEVKTVPNFVQKCIELCWLMCVQDPPVVIGGEATVGDTFDTNIYKPYTNSGTVVSYNVWPPLLLHENGPILVKGVVQPQKMERKKTMERRNLDQTKPAMAAKQRTDYNQTQRVEPTVRLTGQSGYDPHEDAYGRFEQDRKMKSQRNDTRRNHNADAVHSKTSYKAPDTQEKVYDTDLYRSPVRGHVESTNTYGQNHEYQTLPPSTNYVQTKVSPRAEHHLIKSGGVTYIKIGNEYYHYDVYKSVYGSREESYA